MTSLCQCDKISNNQIIVYDWCYIFNTIDIILLIIENLLTITDYIYTKETRKYVKNLLEAYPKLVLNTYVKNLIDFLVISRYISNYITFVDDFMPKNTKKWPTESNGNISYLIAYSTNGNANFYYSYINQVVYSDYFDYNDKIRNIIYQNIKKLFGNDDITNATYKKLIENLILSKRKKFIKKLCRLVLDLNNDLKSIDISLEQKKEIINKLLKSFDWKYLQFKT